ncbi:fimbrial biogenesis outer membrane usher protein [Enterobacter hormaechei]|uniref:fimbria/pilus outer membrane usher protein n=1 Tax=Enterobacter hormaechei TaxID=158836 RepID=UPI0020B68CB2|nr:fimbria/pilus outer membrane usher protein [Enterobacter hormaechei]MCP3812510.1 fimbrial biogenesis outer membrane usher protein [Enterobacter hormaechei]MCP3823282.1 fimbrial biogenesis outer membrane usher protein [Enterobacter hormaechei]MCW4624170.1 fimbrial biogenesis outer membrane usher protein [Enterobacter hormaechei]
MKKNKSKYLSRKIIVTRLSPLWVAMSGLSGQIGATALPVAQIAKNVQFDSSFLQLENVNAVDLNRYANGASITPGTYNTAVFVNGHAVGNVDVEMREREDKTVFPCMTASLLKQIPFRYEHLPAHFFEKAGECGDLHALLPEAVTRYDSNEMRLDIQLPQLYVSDMARGSVSPALWDSGIPAAILGYNLNGYQNTSNDIENKSFYAGINAGLNIGAWYLRHNGSYNWNSNGFEKYDAINTYLQRDIPALKARALIGQSNTRGDVFDTLPFTGVALATDERMLPESQRGFAPEIRGIARTNAKVTVRQGDAVIYQTTVAPGAFLIDDLYPTGYGGDLLVTVEEADGTRQSFSVPYAAVVEQLRPGATRFELVGGELRNDFISHDVALYQGTVRHGLTNLLTGYGGMQVSQNYYALLGGVAVGTEYGAFSFDVTQARMHLHQTEKQASSGQSYRLSYSKTVSETQSNISVAAYRFSSSGFMDFMTAQQTLEAIERGASENAISRSRNRFSVTASQGLPGAWGQLYISGSVQDYWNKTRSDKQYQMGYNNSYGSVSYGVSVGRTYSLNGTEDTWLLTMSMPLGRSDSTYRPQLSTQLTHDSTGRTGEQATLSGTGGEEHQFSYSATAMNANQGVGASGALSGQYRTQYANLSASWSGGRNYHSESLGANGTIVAHQGGVTLSSYTSDTFALVEAKGATGASVSGYPGVRIDRFGYALVPYLDPYQMNNVILDPKGASDEVEMVNTEKRVAPYFGALVKVKYGTKTGSPVLINATLNGQPVPFGAEVLDEKGRSVGNAGQGGQLYARVEQQQGTLTVRWGQGNDQQCEIRYHLMPVSSEQKNTHIQTFNSVCKPQMEIRPRSGDALAMQVATERLHS